MSYFLGDRENQPQRLHLSTTDGHLVVLSMMAGSHKVLNKVSAIIAMGRFQKTHYMIILTATPVASQALPCWRQSAGGAVHAVLL